MTRSWIPFFFRRWLILPPIVIASVTITVLVALRLREWIDQEKVLGAFFTSAGMGALAMVASFFLDWYKSNRSFQWQATKQVAGLLLAVLVGGVIFLPKLRSNPDTYYSSSPDKQYVVTETVNGLPHSHQVMTSREIGRKAWAEEVAPIGGFTLAFGVFSIISLGRNFLPRHPL